MTRCQFATLTRRITAAALTALAIALPHKGASATGFLYDCTMEDVEAGAWLGVTQDRHCPAGGRYGHDH